MGSGGGGGGEMEKEKERGGKWEGGRREGADRADFQLVESIKAQLRWNGH